MLEQAGILASPRSLSAQDPSQPEIPVNPRSQSAQDPSQPWMPSCLFGSCLFGIWLMTIWYLGHAYRGSSTYTKITKAVSTTTVFGLCKCGIFTLTGDLLQSHWHKFHVTHFKNVCKAGNLCIWYLAHAYLFMAHVKPPSRKLSNTYLDFSHLYLAHAHFSQSKKKHEPRTCCTLFSALICCSYTLSHIITQFCLFMM